MDCILTYTWKVVYYGVFCEMQTVACNLNYQQAYRLKKRLDAKHPHEGVIYVLVKEPHVEVK